MKLQFNFGEKTIYDMFSAVVMKYVKSEIDRLPEFTNTPEYIDMLQRMRGVSTRKLLLKYKEIK